MGITFTLSHFHFHTFTVRLSLSLSHFHFHTFTFTLSLSHFHFHTFTFTGWGRTRVALVDQEEDEHHAPHELLQPCQVGLGDGDQDNTFRQETYFMGGLDQNSR